jgi:hypothetical protein
MGMKTGLNQDAEVIQDILTFQRDENFKETED